MKKSVKISCYIEEYKNSAGQLCARIRDKKTNKIVALSGSSVDKRHFLMFLSKAKMQQGIMPTIYDRGGSDIIAVRGYIASETDAEINVCIDTNDGGYLFE